jgi:hypothetical protein
MHDSRSNAQYCACIPSRRYRGLHRCRYYLVTDDMRWHYRLQDHHLSLFTSATNLLVMNIRLLFYVFFFSNSNTFRYEQESSLGSLCYLKTLFPHFCTSSADYVCVCGLSDSLNTSDKIGINVNMFTTVFKSCHNNSGWIQCGTLGLPAGCNCLIN